MRSSRHDCSSSRIWKRTNDSLGGRYDKEDWEYTMDMMVAKRIDASAMITNVVSLEELPGIFDALHSPTDQCKVIIDLSR